MCVCVWVVYKNDCEGLLCKLQAKALAIIAFCLCRLMAQTITLLHREAMKPPSLVVYEAHSH